MEMEDKRTEESMLIVRLGSGFVVEPLKRPVRRIDFCGVQTGSEEDGEFFMVCDAAGVERAKGLLLEKRLEWVKKERDNMLEEAERYSGILKELEEMRSKIAVKDIELVDWCEVSFWAGNKQFKVSQRKVPGNDKTNFPECDVEYLENGIWRGRCLASKLGECKRIILDKCGEWLKEKESKLKVELEEVEKMKAEVENE